MSEIYKKSSSNLRLLEKLELILPGYRGYKEKELRRETDRLIRNYLLSRIQPAYRDFKNAMKAIALSGDQTLATEYNEVQAIFDRVISKLKTMSYGYTGFFDLVKVEEQQLDKMIEFDWNLVSTAERIQEKARNVAKSDPGKLREALDDLKNELLSLEDTLINRENIIKGVGEK
jgi:hypothetical protein